MKGEFLRRIAEKAPVRSFEGVSPCRMETKFRGTIKDRQSSDSDLQKPEDTECGQQPRLLRQI